MLDIPYFILTGFDYGLTPIEIVQLSMDHLLMLPYPLLPIDVVALFDVDYFLIVL